MTTPPLNKHDTIGILNAIRNETTLKFGLRRGHTITSLVPPDLAGRLLDHLFDLCRTELLVERNKERSKELRAEMVAKAQQAEGVSTHASAGSTHASEAGASSTHVPERQAEGGSTHPAKLSLAKLSTNE